MREKLFLFASIAFLIGSADHVLFVTPSVAESDSSASPEGTFTASIRSTSKHAVAPIRRVLVQLQNEKETSPQYQTHYRQRIHTHQEPFVNYHQFPQPIVQKPVVQSIHPAIDKPDIKIQHRLLADEVLKLMPKECHNNLKNFYVRYNNMDGRGLGGKSTIILNGNVSDDEFRALFVHEFGHVVDLGCLQGSLYARNTQYKDGNEVMKENDPSISFYQISWLSSHSQRKGSTPEDFVSGYASWDMFEDFAESFAYYMLHRNEFAKRAQENAAVAAKFAWFQQHLPTLPTVAISNHQWNGTVPWDITKLKFTWIANEHLAQETNRY